MKTQPCSISGLRHAYFNRLGAALVAGLTLLAASGRAPAQSLTNLGTALQFNGSNSYVEIADHSRLRMTINYTLECWFRTDATNSTLRGLVSKYHTPAANGYILRLSNNQLEFDEMSTTNANLQLGRWYHVAAVNNNGTRRLYLNGTEHNLTGTALAVGANTNPLCLGRDYTNAPGRVLNPSSSAGAAN